MQWTIRHSIFLPLLVTGVFSGVFLGVVLHALWVSVFALLCIGALSMVVLFTHSRSKGSTAFFATLLFLCALLLGSSRAYTFDASIPDDLLSFEGRRVVVEGVVVNAPEARESTARFRVAVETVFSESVRGVVLVSTDPFTEVSYGDRVRIEGTLERPQSFETDAGRVFDYEKFLRTHRVTHTVSFAETSVLAEHQGSALVSLLYGIKNAFVERIEVILPDPEAPLLAGLLLGERESLGEELYESFQRAGVVHMIVLSGYNVSLVAQALIKTTEVVLPRLASITVAGAGIVAFALMTGATETTVRASLMAGVLLLASVLRRPHSALRALLIAGALMVLVNPYILLYDLSFQLSFVATAGIVLFAEPLSRRLMFITPRFGIREIAGATLVAQLAVLPLLITSIGSVSLVAPIANVLVLGAVPWAMLGGFVASVLAFVHPLLAFPVTLITQGFLSYILTVSVWFGNLSFAAITIPVELVATLLTLCAGTLFFVSYRFMKRDTVLKLPHR